MNNAQSYRASLVLIVAIVVGFCSDELSAQCAPTPAEKPVALKVLDIGNVSHSTFQRRAQPLMSTDFGASQLYIIIYGSKVETAKRVKRITDLSLPRAFDRSRITLVFGGGRGPRSVFWKIPPGADNPVP